MGVSRKTINTAENHVFVPSTVFALKLARETEDALARLNFAGGVHDYPGATIENDVERISVPYSAYHSFEDDGLGRTAARLKWTCALLWGYNPEVDRIGQVFPHWECRIGGVEEKMPKERWMRFWTLAVVLVASTVLAACVQPTGSSDDGGAGSGGGSNQTPVAPPVDDYTTLFQIAEDGVYVLPGTAGTDNAAIGDGSVSIGDVDNDGDLDVVLAGEGGTGGFTAVYLNDGTGVFTDAGASLTAVGADAATALGDVNGDGTLDLFITGDESTGAGARLYTNEIVDGKPVFTEDASASFAALIQGQARFFDADGDDDLDLLVTGLYNSSDYRAHLYVNQGPDDEGTFELSDNGGTPSLAGTVQRGSVGIADFDGEDGLDIVLTGMGSSGRGTTLLLNDGSGVFAASAQSFLGLSSWSSTSVADFDGNGSSDLFITGYYASNDFRARLRRHRS